MPSVDSYEYWLAVVGIVGQGVLVATAGVLAVSGLWRVFRGIARA